ncbi:MAG: PrsW family glutamic-type intramembrane protease [bacterium]
MKIFCGQKWIYNQIEFDEVMDGIVYCVASSLGFATVENIIYVLDRGAGTGILRAFLSVSGYAFFWCIDGLLY